MGKASSVRQSPHLEVITELLLAGWSAERVREYLVALHGEGPEIPSGKAIRRYRVANLPATAVLPASVIRRALQGIEYRVDAAVLLDELIWAQEQRIGLLWAREQETGNVEGALDGCLRTVLEFLRVRHRLARDVGALGEPKEPRDEVETGDALVIPESSFEEIVGLLRSARRAV